jgi:transcriptional regulator with XRE-family HTH domain
MEARKMIRATHSQHDQRTKSKAYQEGVHVVAANLVAKRELAGLTQLQLAEMIGAAQPAVARLERCSRSDHHATVDLGFLTDIASALGVPVHTFFIPGFYQRPAAVSRSSTPHSRGKSFESRARAARR